MPETQSVFQKYLVPIAIVVAGALIAGAVYFSNSGGSGAPDGGQPPSVNVKDVKIQADDPVIGDKNAKVTLAYWFDYQCPFCKAFDVGGIPQIPIEPSLPTLVKDYVETGKLKIVFKDYAFLGPDSETAALYKHAVWELYPDKFYEWHEAMFVAQDEENGGFGDEASILALSRKISGLDAEALKAKVAEKREAYLAFIDEDRAEGAKFGIQGTPGVITGTTLIPGADDLSTFKAAIDAQL
ncbi:thioredoxin domain-containing protein [Candidatus Kaiserbacteria bacterium]|nr:thioredoxin domain-containing protein [Candidatus Kaiserbacteria bacterium]